MGNMKRIKIILVPYPAQGHVTPMLKLASAFVHRGFHPVMIIPQFIHRTTKSSIDPNANIQCTPIPDGLGMDVSPGFFAIEGAMESSMPTHLQQILERFEEDGETVACMIVDLLASWAIQVGRQCGIPVAGFWPAMLPTFRLISAIPDLLRTGLISETGSPQHLGPICYLSDQPLLSTGDLPWLIGTPASRKARFEFWKRTLNRSRNLTWLLVNSFPEECLEDPAKQRHHEGGKVFPAEDSATDDGPLIVHVGALSKHARVKNPSFWEEDRSCLKWLDEQRPRSVLYISFGSWVSPIEEEKMRSLALALEAARQSFIWVLRPKWREGLGAGLLDRVSKLGKVVSWAPQVEVLQHKAVGCFLSHCGWNSTMEAVQSKKPLLCYPVAGDQFVNSIYIVEKWKIGVRINAFGRKDIEEGIKMVMNDDAMKHRLMKAQEVTMGEEANSKMMSRLSCFVNHLKNMYYIRV